MMKNLLMITPFIWKGGPWRGKRPDVIFSSVPPASAHLLVRKFESIVAESWKP